MADEAQIWCCHGSGVGLTCSSNLTSCPGTFIGCRCSHKKKREKETHKIGREWFRVKNLDVSITAFLIQVQKKIENSWLEDSAVTERKGFGFWSKLWTCRQKSTSAFLILEPDSHSRLCAWEKLSIGRYYFGEEERILSWASAGWSLFYDLHNVVGNNNSWKRTVMLQLQIIYLFISCKRLWPRCMFAAE